MLQGPVVENGEKTSAERVQYDGGFCDHTLIDSDLIDDNYADIIEGIRDPECIAPALGTPVPLMTHNWFLSGNGGMMCVVAPRFDPVSDIALFCRSEGCLLRYSWRSKQEEDDVEYTENFVTNKSKATNVKAKKIETTKTVNALRKTQDAGEPAQLTQRSNLRTRKK
ncbi:hypothetical protein AZE42_04580 [Rhizopogon vesiculosus]|uniref:Uncharacterized protein n=1 Tax=Rhizopogon vesiculosus TaxID=180088 RepID=A0A1J8QCW3_9AGAM|nr:hypothetical protein AZE42_04580 [Rhizopogon vesiculosus]